MVVIGLLPPLFWMAILWFSQVQHNLFLFLVREDGWIENAQVVLFVVGAVLSTCVAWMLGRRGQWRWAAAYGAAALGLLWVSGEEISWGQRIFNLQIPAWLLSNVQHETNVHNLPGVSKAIERWVLHRGILVVIILSAVVWRVRPSWLVRWQADLWIPHPILIPALSCVWSYVGLRKLYVYSHQTTDISAVAQFQEPRELILAFAVVVFLMIILCRVNRMSKEGSTLVKMRAG